MPRLTLDPDPREEPFLHRLSQLIDSLLRGDDEPQPNPCKEHTHKTCQLPKLGLVASMKFALSASSLVLRNDQRSVEPILAASTPADIAKVLDELATAGKAVHIVFISASEEGRRWGKDCAAAEASIVGVLRSYLPRAWKIDLVEAAVPQAQWCTRPSSERHPFWESEIFGRIQLPLLIGWADGRATERLGAPMVNRPYPSRLVTKLPSGLMRCTATKRACARPHPAFSGDNLLAPSAPWRQSAAKESPCRQAYANASALAAKK